MWVWLIELGDSVQIYWAVSKNGMEGDMLQDKREVADSGALKVVDGGGKGGKRGVDGAIRDVERVWQPVGVEWKLSANLVALVDGVVEMVGAEHGGVHVVLFVRELLHVL